MTATTAADARKFRFIPYRKHDIAEMCLSDEKITGSEAEFRNLYYMLGSVFHFEFHKIIESLKDAYAPVDPDADTRPYANAQQLSDVSFVNLLGGLLEKANYERVTEADLALAMQESSLFKIKLHVDFDDFSEVLLFCRGETVKEQQVPRLFGFFPKTIRFSNYDRVVVYIRYKDESAEPAGDVSEKATNPLAGSTLLKLFQNVPKADLEMLFPNTRVRMRTLDKLLIGVPALVSGAIVLTTKLGASLVLLGSLFGFWLGMHSQPVTLNQAALMALLASAAALAGYLFKQVSNFKNRRMRFMQALTQNLYFKNLDNNAGVFHRLANDAEEEECKEALLAYYFLLVNGAPLQRETLDARIEAWFSDKWQCELDFEIDDALEKLVSLRLVEKNEKGLQAVDIKTAIARLDERWDNYFVPS